LEKGFHALEHLKKSVLARANIFDCLKAVRITMNRTIVLRRIHTERRTPIPTKIVFAGENTCETTLRMQFLGHFDIMGHTRLKAPPRACENE